MSYTASSFSGTSMKSAAFTTTRPVRVHVSRSNLAVQANLKVQKKQKIILTQDLANVGKEGEIKSVPIGYWRNYLQPNGIAKLASETILDQIRRKKEAELRTKLEEKAQAQAFANALGTIGKFIIKKKVGEKDQIYGSVSVKDITDAIYQQTGRNLSDNKFEVPEIKSIGTYEVRVELHPEVKGTFSVVIQREKNASPVKVVPTPDKKAKK